MANLQIKNIDEQFFAQIKSMADAEQRSMSQQVLYVIKEYLSKRKELLRIKTTAQVLLDLSGSWEDANDSEGIIAEI
ncbi:MAG: hypothetical protein WAU91_15185 [Desulfatitalea sp.]